MKKMLFLIPLLGICSSLFAQAPQVTNVQAEQIPGTKDVAISFELTGKDDGVGSGHPVHGEVWFKENDSMTTWTKVSSIYSEIEVGDWQPANLTDFDPATGTTTATHSSIHIGMAGLSPITPSFMWKAGDDAPNINTTDAKIRIIAFYPKMNEFDATEKPAAEQVSGWNGEGDFGASGGSPDGNDPGSPDGNDPVGDSDGDGFSDDEEIGAGSDPYDPGSYPGSNDPGSNDTGSNDPGSNDPGSPDGNDPVGDSDGDGFSDDEEIGAGSDPYDPASFPGV
jgi:hypothetical protein